MKALIDAKINPITSSKFEGDLLIDDGKIVDFGSNIDIPEEADIIDLDGKKFFQDS